MWLSEKTALAGVERQGQADCGRVTIGGREPAVETDGEHRSPVILAPGGVCWLPAAGQEAVLLRCEDGTEVLLGTAQGEAPAELLSGEVCIRAGTASIRVGLDGQIRIQGAVNIIGGLTVNGKTL